MWASLGSCWYSRCRSHLVPTKYLVARGHYSCTSAAHLLRALLKEFWSTMEKQMKNTSAFR